MIFLYKENRRRFGFGRFEQCNLLFDDQYATTRNFILKLLVRLHRASKNFHRRWTIAPQMTRVVDESDTVFRSDIFFRRSKLLLAFTCLLRH